MPLESGNSKAAFVANVKTELAAGKSREQSLAIAYAKQRDDSAMPRKDCVADHLSQHAGMFRHPKR